MALLDLVEYLDPTGNVLAARVPPDGSGELRLGSQCIVREGQLAFFARDGRFLDMLIPGRHTLDHREYPAAGRVHQAAVRQQEPVPRRCLLCQPCSSTPT